MKKVRAKKPGIIAASMNPYYRYEFVRDPKTDESVVIEMPDEHAEKILGNTDLFEEVKSGTRKYSKKELESLKMGELRKIGDSFGVKDTDKNELVKEILGAQG